MEHVDTTGLEVVRTINAVRARRAELRGSLDLLELALAKPTRDRDVVWGETVHAALRHLARDFDAHIEVTEGAGGLHEAILAGDLRLANAVAELTRQHETIASDLARLVGDTEAPVVDAGAIRERATHTLGHLIRHRQRGADLIYEAYDTDIGGDG